MQDIKVGTVIRHNALTGNWTVTAITVEWNWIKEEYQAWAELEQSVDGQEAVQEMLVNDLTKRILDKTLVIVE